MGKRLMWVYGPVWRQATAREATPAEVLAEMDTEVLVEELERREFRVVTNEGSFVERPRGDKENG